MATTSKTTRTSPRKPAQSRSESVCIPEVKFPLDCAKPRQTSPEEVLVLTAECAADSVRLRLMPDPAAIVRIMDETFGVIGWTRRYYFADGRLWCGVGVYHPLFANYAVKDASAPAEKLHIKNPDKWKEDGSFLAAAALWGAGSDVLSLKPLLFKADQVEICPIRKAAQKAGDPPAVIGYRLASVLHVDKFLRDDSGRIIGVQLVDKEGRKAVWQEE